MTGWSLGGENFQKCSRRLGTYGRLRLEIADKVRMDGAQSETLGLVTVGKKPGTLVSRPPRAS